MHAGMLELLIACSERKVCTSAYRPFPRMPVNLDLPSAGQNDPLLLYARLCIERLRMSACIMGGGKRLDH